MGPEPKVLQQRVRSIRQADRMTWSSVTFQKSLKKQPHPRSLRRCLLSKHNKPELECLIVWGLLVNQRPYRGLSLRTCSSCVPAPAGEAGTVPMCPTVTRPLEQPRLQQQACVDGIQVGPQLTRHSIAFHTRNSNQDLQQAVDAMLSMGAIERVLNEASRVLQPAVSGAEEDRGSASRHRLSTLHRHLVVPHFKMETQASHQAAVAVSSQEWTVSIDIRDAYLHVPMHRAVKNYLRFRVNKKTY